jgi:hypothetical protein
MAVDTVVGDNPCHQTDLGSIPACVHCFINMLFILSESQVPHLKNENNTNPYHSALLRIKQYI